MIQTLEILKALSDLNRLRIVAALGRYDELCACQITELLQVTGATASRHLSVLQQSGVLDSRKEGRWIYYRLAPPVGTKAVFRWVNESTVSSKEIMADVQALEKIVEIGREDLCRMQRGEECCPRK
ncbi:MAG: transcriptional regulator [Verrucomicrobia bacterium]|nr:MAG: transcriptional regulator [Verrucomicrobiota bacterium]